MGESDMVAGVALPNQEARALYVAIASGQNDSPGESPELRELLLLGLVAADPDAPGRYHALDATVTADRLRDGLLRSAYRALEQATAVPDAFRAMAEAYGLANPPAAAEGAVELVDSQEGMQARMAPLLASCTSELLTAQPGGPRPPAMLAMSYQRDLAVLARGAKMRTLYRASVRQDPPTCRWVDTMSEQGAEVRTLPQRVEFPRTVIIDERVAVVGCVQREGGTIVRDPSLVRYMRHAWLRDWERALPWAAGDVEVTPRQKAVLQRLAGGDTLETAARALGVSRRMVGNYLEPLRVATGSVSLLALLYWWAGHEEHYDAVKPA